MNKNLFTLREQSNGLLVCQCSICGQMWDTYTEYTEEDNVVTLVVTHLLTKHIDKISTLDGDILISLAAYSKVIKADNKQLLEIPTLIKELRMA